jgi:aminoglycoside phosphotransferase (APT) family kinase protein
MDVEQARLALAGIGLEVERLAPIQGGWCNWTFDMDGRWIARFPRDADAAAGARRELSLLPELAAAVGFQVPEPRRSGILDGAPFFVYPRVRGRAMRKTDRGAEAVRGLAAMVAELHAFPTARAAELLGLEPTVAGWRRYYEELWPAVEREALPVLDTDLGSGIRRAYRDFVEGPLDFPVRLVHFDLGPEHVRIDPETGLPRGMIDFHSARIGDPVVDLCRGVGRLLLDDGWPALAREDLGSDAERRGWFYFWMGSLHAVIHGVRMRDGAEVAYAAASLRTRFAGRPR